MLYQFGLQKTKEFGRHSEICKSLRGVGMIIAKYFNGTYDPLGHHSYVPQINEASHYLTPGDILKSSESDLDFFRQEGKQIINVCTNCGQVYDELKKAIK
jgi:hypothetical protein